MTIPNKTALLFCQDIDGHRQNYAAVIGDWFRSRGWSVVAALADAEDGGPPGEVPVIKQLLEGGAARLIHLGDASNDKGGAGYWVKTLRKIEDEVRPGWTVLVVGDQCRVTLRGLGDAGVANGTQRAAIFIYVSHVYPPSINGLSFPDKLMTGLRWVRNYRRQQGYFRRTVWRTLGLDRILTTNGDFQQRAGDARIRLIPEIYKAWGFDMEEEDPGIEQLRKDYRSFLEKHQGREVILYYGTRFARRGYDTLLALVRNHEDTVFVSFGRDADGQAFEHDVEKLRQELKAGDRLYEVKRPFLPENPFIDDLFRSARYILLPYRRWLGASGILTQAAGYGKPVLVPDIGHMASIVRRHGIGLTYAHGYDVDLYSQFGLLREKCERYAPAALEFGRSHDREHLYRALDNAFDL